MPRPRLIAVPGEGERAYLKTATRCAAVAFGARSDRAPRCSRAAARIAFVSSGGSSSTSKLGTTWAWSRERRGATEGSSPKRRRRRERSPGTLVERTAVGSTAGFILDARGATPARVSDHHLTPARGSRAGCSAWATCPPSVRPGREPPENQDAPANAARTGAASDQAALPRTGQLAPLAQVSLGRAPRETPSREMPPRHQFGEGEGGRGAPAPAPPARRSAARPGPARPSGRATRASRRAAAAASRRADGLKVAAAPQSRHGAPDAHAVDAVGGQVPEQLWCSAAHLYIVRLMPCALLHCSVAYLDNGKRSSTVLDTNAQKNAGRRAATS